MPFRTDEKSVDDLFCELFASFNLPKSQRDKLILFHHLIVTANLLLGLTLAFLLCSVFFSFLERFVFIEIKVCIIKDEIFRIFRFIS